MTAAANPVLIIDPHDDSREGLREILEANGWPVATERQPRTALNRIIDGFRPCLVLLDLMSPTMNGVEFRRELMGQPQLPPIPLVAYSGLKRVRQAARELATNPRTPVPAVIDRLLAAVRQHCATSPRRSWEADEESHTV